MASIVPPPPPQSTIVVGPRPDECLIDEQIKRTRRTLKRVDFLSGVLTLVIGVLVFLLFASVVEHWVIPGGWNTFGRVVLWIALLGGAAWYSWRTFWPLFSRPINPAYAAQLIERSTPSLKNSLLNFLLLRGRRQQYSQKVFQAIEQQAAQGLTGVSAESAVDRSALLRLGYVLAGVVAVCALYRVLSPKNLTASMERVLMPWSSTAAPSRVKILNVLPGDTEIARGESLEISAEVLGLAEGEAVRIRYSTLDKQAVDREITLNGAEGSARFQGRLPDRFLPGESGGVQQDLDYWVVAGDAVSPKYRVTVFARPTLVVEKVHYQFPPYTKLPPREVVGTGDVSAIEGTQVSIYAIANHEIANASVDFNADGRHDLPMVTDQVKASAQFTLALQEDRRTPEYDSYVLQYKTTSGRTSSLPPKYSIAVTPDYAPEVKIIAPVDDEGKLVEQLDVAVDVPFTVEVEARDPDFALKNVVILGEVGGEQKLTHDLLTNEQSGRFVGRMTATPQELGLQAGDVMDYWVAAIDNRQPEPNVTHTDKLRVRVVGPPQFGERPQGEQQPGAGQQGGESGEGGQSEDGMQGPGEAGGSGEENESGKGEQQGEGAAGGQQGQQGEQQGGGEGNQGGESASADGGQQGEQQQNGTQENGDQQQGDPQPGEQQQSDPQPGEQQSDSQGQGSEQQRAGDGEQGKVSPEGDNDAEAFERMSEHFAEQDADSQGEGQQSKAAGETDQSESQNQSETRQGDGEGSPDEQEPTAESGRNQDQGIDGAQEGEESQGSGAEGQPNEQRQQQPSDAESGDESDRDAPGGKMGTEQGEPGAGNNPGENEGSMDTDHGRKSRDKKDEGPESELNDEEAPGQANSQKESDTQGGQGGDNSGGGQEGAGQQADSEGTGAAGENTAADDGGGQAAEQGAGENSSQPGQQGTSDKPTGQSSETQPGEGSQQADQSSGSKPGGDQTGQAAGDDASQSPSSEQSPAGQPADEPPAGDEAQPQSDSSDQPEASGPPSGQQGGQSPTGGTGGNPTAPPPGGDPLPGDEANLEYAKKQTDLVLDRLEDQLEKQDVDKQLLEKLGWTEDELRRFVDRWKTLKAEAETAPSEESRQQLDKALRSLGLDPNRRTGYQANATKEKLRQLQQSYRGQIPLEYADQVRAYIKGTATAGDESDE